MPSKIQLKKVAFEDFDPNNLPVDQPLWAVYNGYGFKTFSRGRGPALISFMDADRAKLYEFVGNTWVLRVTKDAHSRSNYNCDRCGCSDAHITYRKRYPIPSVAYVWERHGGSIAAPLNLMFLCSPCNTSHNYT